MTKDDQKPTQPPRAAKKAEARSAKKSEARSAALRANLLKRKAQIKTRAAQTEDEKQNEKED